MMNKEGSNQIANFITQGPGTGVLLLGRERISYSEPIRARYQILEQARRESPKAHRTEIYISGELSGSIHQNGLF